jgi:transposase
MEQVHHIRQQFYGQGKSISEIAVETGFNWKTVRKYVDMEDFNSPLPQKASERRLCPKLEPYKQLIDQWLEADKQSKRKQRHTAKRTYDRLRKEAAGFDCSYRLVAEYVAVRKKELHLGKKDGYMPLVHRPGEAQADFGEADFFENGEMHTGKYLVITFPYSNAGFVQLNYGENTECLLEGLDAIFRHIGGVPTEIWFDNASTMVTDILKGGGRNLTERFIRFREHYGFESIFMNPSSGWEKGSTENKVGYSRRNFMVPTPRFIYLPDYNKKLLSDCDEDTGRDHYRFDLTIKDLFAEDQKRLLALPNTPFDLSGYGEARTNGWGKFTLNDGKHEYSVSPKYANAVVNLRFTSSLVEVLDGDFQKIVSHRRLYGDEKQRSMEWLPYLRYIAQRPRSLRNTGIYDMMPDDMKKYMDNCNNKERGKALRVLAELTDRTGFNSAMQTVSQAIMYNVTDPESLKNLYRRLYTDVPELPPMTFKTGLPTLEQMPVNLKEYDLYLVKGGVDNG